MIIMNYTTNDNIILCENTINKLLIEANVFVKKSVLTKIALDIMNISYAKGGDYSEKTIKKFAKIYIEQGLYKKFTENIK